MALPGNSLTILNFVPCEARCCSQFGLVECERTSTKLHAIRATADFYQLEVKRLTGKSDSDLDPAVELPAQNRGRWYLGSRLADCKGGLTR